MPQRFGSAHTSNKLDKLERYLTTYSTALKNQDFRLIFFDAFAGTGQIQVSEAAPLLESITEYGPFIIGSTERALQLGKAFDEYIFVERSAQKVQRLAELKKKYPNVADRVSIAQGDANSELQRFALQTDWRKCRAVVFLDPFGNDVEWRTIEAIALTKAVDLWYLFPAGISGTFSQPDWAFTDRSAATGLSTTRMAHHWTECWERRNGELLSLKRSWSQTYLRALVSGLRKWLHHVR